MPNKHKIVIKLKQILYDKNMTQTELAKRTGLREGTISKFSNNKYERVQLDHVLALMLGLDISNFNDFFEIVDLEEEREVKM